MDVTLLSTHYLVRKLRHDDLADILELCERNVLFYQYHPPMPTQESILKDMEALPPGKIYEDKYYIGFWDSGRLIAVMDLILDYPNNGTAFIGFFMVNALVQGKGVGTKIITESLSCIAENSFQSVQLGIDKGNPQSEAFWLKNGFTKNGREYCDDSVSYVYMCKTLL